MQKKQSSAPASGLPATPFIAVSAVFLIVALLLAVALFSYNPADPAWRHNGDNAVTNTLGALGAWYSDLSFSLIGKLSYLLPLTLVAFFVHVWREKQFDKELFSWRLFMLLTAVLSGCVLWTKHDPALINSVAQTGGGALGAWLTIGLEKSVKSISIIMAFSAVIFAISISLLFNIPWLRFADWIGGGIMALFNNLLGRKSQDTPRQVNSPADTAAADSTVLQDKINHLNETTTRADEAEAIAEKAAQAAAKPVEKVPQTAPKKPAFTIDRYEPESVVDEVIEPPRFAQEKPAQPVATPRAEPVAPIQLKAEKPAEKPAKKAEPFEFASDKKSEPNFFDFDGIGAESSKTSSLDNAIEKQRASLRTATASTTSSMGADNLIEAFAPKSTQTPKTAPVAPAATVPAATATPAPAPVMADADPLGDFSFEDEMPLSLEIPAAKPVKKTVLPPKKIVVKKPAPKVTRTVKVEPQIQPQAQPAAQAAPQPQPVAQPAVQAQPEPEPQPVAEKIAEDSIHAGIVDQTVVQPQSTFEAPKPAEPAPVTAEPVAEKPPVQAPVQAQPVAPVQSVAKAAPAATTATIGKAYDGSAEAAETQVAEQQRPYELPSIQLLDTPPPQENAYTEDALAEMAGVLEKTLNTFKIDATVMHVSPGPVITRFELDLAPGIQAKKITALSQDLARALAVSRVRVEEVIPGSSYVGLEVPNKQRQTVYFKDIVCSKVFRDSKSPLTISLGSDTSGKPQVGDLMKMPHALVAGTTGSGKSVCINAMLLSMLYKASPKDLRLILVDPKMLEMSMYEDIPHLLTPVITDMNEAENALTWAVGEMERRYQLMSELKVRKIDAFNAMIDEATANGESIKDPLWQPDESVGYTHHPSLERLPFIVIVIDELADMMMVVGKQVEQLIARLTQKARAAGIHVVLATQRPSTDVLTGLIKANVPTRIAFQVSSGTDSRVIIDGVGAEKLLGHGDMLYVPPGASHPQRLHGAFVGDAETDRITDYLRSTGEPQYIDGITGKQDPESLGAFGAAEAAEAKEDADPLYEDAVNIVLETGKASISSVQRHLRIGYNRAARMIEDMQAQGIVSEPVNGVRKVLGR